jgi:internalin A
LERNDLQELPVALQQLQQLEELTLHGNPALGIAPEILGPTYGVSSSSDPPAKPADILDFYFRIQAPDEGQPLHEFKLILVGRGGVGKTSLVHRLVTGKYQVFPPTDGIAITMWPVKVAGTMMRAHVWDFGGQEVMHGTHRFFMTERGRENRAQHDAEYWLSLIRSFAGPEVPVLVLLHKKTELPCQVDRKIIREKYGEQIEFLETDSTLPDTMEDLYRQLEHMGARLPGLDNKWPKTWHRVKQELPAAEEHWLS